LLGVYCYQCDLQYDDAGGCDGYGFGFGFADLCYDQRDAHGCFDHDGCDLRLERAQRVHRYGGYGYCYRGRDLYGYCDQSGDGLYGDGF